MQRSDGTVGTHHSSHSVTEIPQMFRELTRSQMFGTFLRGGWVSFCGGRLTKPGFIHLWIIQVYTELVNTSWVARLSVQIIISFAHGSWWEKNEAKSHSDSFISGALTALAVNHVNKFLLKKKTRVLAGALTCKGMKMTDGGLTLFFFAASLMIASASFIWPRETSHRGDSGMYLPREVKGGTRWHNLSLHFLSLLRQFFCHKVFVSPPPTTRKVYRAGWAAQELRAASSSLELKTPTVAASCTRQQSPDSCPVWQMFSDTVATKALFLKNKKQDINGTGLTRQSWKVSRTWIVPSTNELE